MYLHFDNVHKAEKFQVVSTADQFPSYTTSHTNVVQHTLYSCSKSQTGPNRKTIDVAVGLVCGPKTFVTSGQVFQNECISDGSCCFPGTCFILPAGRHDNVATGRGSPCIAVKSLQNSASANGTELLARRHGAVPRPWPCQSMKTLSISSIQEMK